jgi:ATPases involved in chromosome partitioning
MITKNEQLRIPSTLMEIDHILGIFSAKGGVGKSVISVNLAKSLVSKGFKVGLVDGDIYGPSHPVLLNATDMHLKVTNQELLDPLEKDGFEIQLNGVYFS